MGCLTWHPAKEDAKDHTPEEGSHSEDEDRVRTYRMSHRPDVGSYPGGSGKIDEVTVSLVRVVGRSSPYCAGEKTRRTPGSASAGCLFV